MARTSRTISGGGLTEAKAGENIGQGKPRREVIEKTRQKNQQEELPGLTDSESEPACWSA
jgi:hypothetical protein